MTSPTHTSPHPRHGSSLLQDEGYEYTPRGGALASLIRRRSSSNILLPATHGRDEEEGAIMASGPHTPVLGGSFSENSDDAGRLLHEEQQRRLNALLNNPQMRSMRLIGKAKRYRWERYWKTDEQLAAMANPALRAYYERNNMLIQQYLYIDRLLNSSLPHDLLNEYNALHSAASRHLTVPATIREEPATQTATSPVNNGGGLHDGAGAGAGAVVKKVNRTPKGIYRPAETTPLMEAHEEDDEDAHDPDDDEEFLARRAAAAAADTGRANATAGTTSTTPSYGTMTTTATPDKTTRGSASSSDGTASPKLSDIPLLLEEDEGVDSSAPIVTFAIYVNFAANAILLAGKLAVVLSVPSISVLASLVDAVLDFLSTAIVWTTTWMISNQDQYRYPVGRRRLEPLGVLVFSVIMITSFVQVMLQAIQSLAGDNHDIIELTLPAILTMLSTIVVKGLCWLWCRLVKNSSVQALADDALTDVIFNAGSIAFPIVGFYARIWWLDALGGLLLSLVVIYNWSRTSIQHIKHLSGFSATADQRNILLYLTMRFAKTIKAIQGLHAYHAGDKLIVEVDIVLDANMSLKDSHDLSESLQYVIESVPIVDRAFVHADYADYNLPTHMEQQAE